MKIGLYVLFDEKDSRTCARDCPFLESGYCDLWSVDLEETELPPGFSWDYKDGPTHHRHWKCTKLDPLPELPEE